MSPGFYCNPLENKDFGFLASEPQDRTQCLALNCNMLPLPAALSFLSSGCPSPGPSVFLGLVCASSDIPGPGKCHPPRGWAKWMETVYKSGWWVYGWSLMLATGIPGLLVISCFVTNYRYVSELNSPHCLSYSFYKSEVQQAHVWILS